MNESQSTATAYLLALGLSKRASYQIETLRRRYWQKTGDISFLMLPPIVPLVWSATSFGPFHALDIESPPTPLVFTDVAICNNFAYSVPGTEYPFVLPEGIRNDTSDVHPPLPSFGGIFLGSDVYPSPFEGSQMGMEEPVIITSWRLEHYGVQWITDQNSLVHVHHQLLFSHHLVMT